MNLGAWVERNREDINAGSTFAVGFFTLVLAASTVGLWLVTWRAARNANDALTQIERAFVFVDDLPKEQIGDEVRFQVIWKNGGNTPAVHVRQLVSMWSDLGKIPELFDYPEKPNVEISVSYIAPKGILRAGGVSLTNMRVREIARDEAFALLWGWIEYDDIFGKARRTEYCYRAAAKIKNVKADDGEAVEDVRFELITHGSFNAVDDDCYRKPTPYKHDKRVNRTQTSPAPDIM